MRWSILSISLLALGIVGVASSYAGPVSELYLTASNQKINYIVQGDTVLLSFDQENSLSSGGESAVAISGTMRTLGDGFSAGLPDHLGTQYTLLGIATGTSYNYPNDEIAFMDGATDGRYNYSVDYNSGDVYRMGLDWSNPTLLFSLNEIGNVGITYDKIDHALWISLMESGGPVSEYSMTGDLLRQFTTSGAATPSVAATSLALDYASNTLWVGTLSNSGHYYEFSRNGDYLGTAYYAELSGATTYGGEFAFPVPEPSTAVLFGAGLTVMALRRGFRQSVFRPIV